MRCKPIGYIKKNEAIIQSCSNCRNKKCKDGRKAMRKVEADSKNNNNSCNNWRR